MSLTYALFCGVLFAVALYLLLRETLVDHIFGLIVLSHAANLIVFGAGQLRRDATPILEDPAQPITDPLPQALVLTAIVIGFGVISFATVLVARLHAPPGTDDVRGLTEDPDD